jgi:hypothetical protein
MEFAVGLVSYRWVELELRPICHVNVAPQLPDQVRLVEEKPSCAFSDRP